MSYFLPTKWERALRGVATIMCTTTPLRHIMFLVPVVTYFLIIGTTAQAGSYNDQDIADLIQQVAELRKRSQLLEQQLELTQKELLKLNQSQTQESSLIEQDKTAKNTAQAKITPQEKPKELDNEKELRIGGKVSLGHRYRYRQDNNENHHERGGDTSLGHLRFDIDAKSHGLTLDAQYRFYPWGDLLHHAYVAYDIYPAWEMQVGVTLVPFGILPYVSNDGWYGISYYMGFEDDYDFGIKFIGKVDDWTIHAAFFKNDEYADPTRIIRYSIDVLSDIDLDQYNRETNQINLQLNKIISHDGQNNTELGASLEWGQLYNDSTGEAGYHDAIALHLKGKYGSWGVMVEAIRYHFSPDSPAGVDDKVILLGGYGGAYLAATNGNIYDLNLSYAIPLIWGPVTKATLFSDYSYLDKDESSFYDSQIFSTGVSFSAGPAGLNFEYTIGKNAIWLGRDPQPMGTGSADAKWNGVFSTQLNYWF